MQINPHLRSKQITTLKHVLHQVTYKFSNLALEIDISSIYFRQFLQEHDMKNYELLFNDNQALKCLKVNFEI